MADCVLCSRPVPDVAYTCATCADTLGRQLHAAADLLPELDTTLARQTRFGEPGPRPRNSAPAESVRLGLTADPDSDRAPGPASGLPYSEAASIDRGTVVNTVSTWTRVVFEQRGGQYPDNPAEAMRWLAGQLGWLRYQPFAGEAFDELDYAARLVVRAVDRPVPRVDAGLCLSPGEDGEPCQQRLSARPGAVAIVCPSGHRHDMAERRRLWLEAAEDLLATATELARWLSEHNDPLPVGTIWSWASRHRLAGRGTDRAGRPLYRLGDARQLLSELRQRRAEKVHA